MQMILKPLLMKENIYSSTAKDMGIVILIFSFVLNRYFLKPIKNLVSYTKTIKDKNQNYKY